MTLDERGRIANRWGITIAAAHDAQLLFVGSQLDAQLASVLQRQSTPIRAPFGVVIRRRGRRRNR
jgi:hypothetical protein